MDTQSPTAIATMAEIAIATNNNNNNNSIGNTSNIGVVGVGNGGGGSNKRKRRSSSEEKDIENKRPPNKKVYLPSADVLNELDNGHNGIVVDFDLYALGSPQNITKLATKTDSGAPKAQQTRSTQNGTNTTTNNSNSTTNMSNTATAMGTSTAEMTPQSLKKTENTWNGNASACKDCSTIGHHKFETRLCPLPMLSWADAKDVWQFMCKKDEKTAIERDPKMLINHPGLQSRMRAILLDWLIEVCEVYKLHRETYYLALDYLDRYLSTNVSISKAHLQLIGITCLFIAAKVEEIYPPKLSEFAYVTDGACREEDILRQELVILTALKWQISPVTIIGWLSVYMQLNACKRSAGTQKNNCNNNNNHDSNSTTTTTTLKEEETDASHTEQIDENADDAFVFLQFSGFEYAQTAQLLDLCTLDVGISNYPYSVIAAAAISHTFNKKTAIKLSGLSWATIKPCHMWMDPFFRVCLDAPRLCLTESNEQVQSKHGMGHLCPNLVADDSHIIQIHTTTMEMFDSVMLFKEKMLQEASPAIRKTVDHICPPEGLLTPPATNRKFIE